jgi:biopolymer transport protein ExbD
MSGPLFPRFNARPTPLDMTPLVDVLMTLILFFMLTSTFVMPFGIAVDVPDVKAAEAVQGAAVEVQVRKSDQILVSGRPVTLEQLRKEAEGIARAGRPVLITGDRGATLGRTLEVWDACKGAGVRPLHIRTEWPDPAAGPGARPPKPR